MTKEQPAKSIEDCKSFGNFMKTLCEEKSSIEVPDYQRTYSWQQKHAEILWNDLQRLHKNEIYFLGLFLLEQDRDRASRYYIIDGQQRFTTLFMLLHLIYKKYPEVEGLTSFLRLDGVPRLKLQKEQNDEYFKEILDLEITNIKDKDTEYYSQKNIRQVYFYLTEKISSEEFTIDVAQSIIDKLKNSKILVHMATDTGQAMQIFELLNDRGKGLTQLESLKSYIMHQIYIKSSAGSFGREEEISTIKECFKNIYRTLNKINEKIKGDFHEDDILRYHYVAFENWQSQTDYRNVNERLKKSFYDIKNTNELKNKTKAIESSFKLIHQIIEIAHNPITDKKWLKNLYILNRMATFYPLLMSIQSKQPEILNDVCNYLELFTYRAFGLLNKRTDAALHSFYTLARDISFSEIDKKAIFKRIKAILNEYTGKDTEPSFVNNLYDSRFYHNQPGIDGRYILIKYENILVEKEAKGYEGKPINSLDDITNFQKRTKDSLSIEHIVAQDLVATEPEYIRSITQGVNKDLKSTAWWKHSDYKNYRENIFEELFLHSLGNLVISRGGPNSEKGKERPEKKYWDGLKSQEEIQNLIASNKRKKGNNFWLRECCFNVDQIVERREKIISFAKEYWSYKYFDPEENFNIQNRSPLI